MGKFWWFAKRLICECIKFFGYWLSWINLPVDKFVAQYMWSRLWKFIIRKHATCESRGGSDMQYTRVFVELATEFSLVYFLFLAFSPLTVWCMHFSAMTSPFFHSLVHQIQIVLSIWCTRVRLTFSLLKSTAVLKTKFSLDTFETRNLACCTVGVEDRRHVAQSINEIELVH